MRRSLLSGGTSARERRLGSRLDAELAPIGAVLHGCRVDASDRRVDHIVVAPSGIWTVIADHSTGRVASIGSGAGVRVTVDGADVDERLAVATVAAERVRGVLRAIDLEWVEVTPALCFTNTRLRPIDVGGVRLVTAKRLVRDVARRGAMLQTDARQVAGAIGRELSIDGQPTRR